MAKVVTTFPKAVRVIEHVQVPLGMRWRATARSDDEPAGVVRREDNGNGPRLSRQTTLARHQQDGHVVPDVALLAPVWRPCILHNPVLLSLIRLPIPAQEGSI